MSGTETTEQRNARLADAAALAALSASLPRYRWLPATAQYYDTILSRVVAHTAIRSALDNAIEASAKNVRAVTEQLRLGEITLAEWQKIMLAEIKSGHLAAVASASGGFDQMTQASFGRAGREIRDQYFFLRRFAEQLTDGSQRMDGTLIRRAMMYAESARKSYEAQRRAEMRVRGVTRHRSVRHATDSCSECVELAARGWQPIGEPIPLPGDRLCRANCRCQITYSN